MDDQQDWKLDSAFRQTIVDKIGLAMTVTKVSLKPQHKKDPVDIERTFCEKAQSRQNYLMLVQRLLDVLSGKNKDSKLTNANNQVTKIALKKHVSAHFYSAEAFLNVRFLFS